MSRGAYLFNTHALVFWANRTSVSDGFIQFFDRRDRQGNLYISSVSFWEIGLLVKKGRLAIEDVHAWKNEILAHTDVQLIDPSAEEMIDSTLLPDYHKDPFDRLLVAQAQRRDLTLVSKDERVRDYEVRVFWL